MKVSTCDLCQKVQHYPQVLLTVRTVYQTEVVKEVCSQCNVMINAYVERLQRITDLVIQEQTKNFINSLRVSLTADVPPSPMMLKW